jgi:hypothetical protein
MITDRNPTSWSSRRKFVVKMQEIILETACDAKNPA